MGCPTLFVEEFKYIYIVIKEYGVQKSFSDF